MGSERYDQMPGWEGGCAGQKVYRRSTEGNPDVFRTNRIGNLSSNSGA